MIVSIQSSLHQKVNESFDQIWLVFILHIHIYVHVHVYMCTYVHVQCTFSILRDVQAQLSADLSDKMMALGIDSECADLANTSTTIALHTDPTRIKKG